MKKFIFILLIVAAGWKIYEAQNVPVLTNADLYLLNEPTVIARGSLLASNTKYSCDGRQHCSQMNSCEEATFFINNCPNTKMDGDHDGIPCERQYCN
ncbi:excalibur calcium-binding domain-containing protein [Gammaproteobacteria bacterium AS21]